MKVQEAIAAIIADLPSIGKSDRSSNVEYAFRGIETLKRHLSVLCAKYGVVYTPHVRLLDINRVVENKQGQMKGWTEVILEVTWTITGPEGDTLTATTIGIGRDNADKGANKAQTQAEKYLLLPLFNIADGKDDADQYDGGVNEPGVPVAPPTSDPFDWKAIGWDSKDQHDNAFGAIRVRIGEADAHAPGFAEAMRRSWAERGLKLPLALDQMQGWDAHVRLEAEKAVAG